ncbi:MAG: sulfotransferase [Methylovulum sp.]|jgi:hypothetical protein|nr:sulfotransferase [Methylovulum sp.]
MIENLLIGAGAMKAGTTWLYKQLAGHPLIHFTPEKELHYFSYQEAVGNKLAHAQRQLKLKKALKRQCNEKVLAWYTRYAEPEEINDDWYYSLFQEVQPRVYCADFSNQYSLLDEAGLNKITACAKNIKVIYTLRDPLERLWSHVKFNYKFNGQEELIHSINIKEFRQILNKEWFWKNTEYLANYDRLERVFGKEHVRLFYLEDFTAFPTGSLWNIEQFLHIRHVDYKHDLLTSKFNQSKELDMPESWQRLAMIRLRPEYEQLYVRGLNHPSWRY